MSLHRPPSRPPLRQRTNAALASAALATATIKALTALASPAPAYAQGPASPDAASGAISQQTDQCKGISTSIHAHAKTIKSLLAENEKEKTKLARSVTGVFRQLTGDPYVSPQTVKNLQRIETEKRLALDLNSVLASLRCPPEDIDRLIGQKPAPKP